MALLIGRKAPVIGIITQPFGHISQAFAWQIARQELGVGAGGQISQSTVDHQPLATVLQPESESSAEFELW